MKKLLLAFGFVLFVVSCGGGGGPSTLSTHTWREHSYISQHYFYEKVNSNTADTITPDPIWKMVYSNRDWLGQDGTMPSVGDNIYVIQFWSEDPWCQFSGHNSAAAACIQGQWDWRIIDNPHTPTHPRGVIPTGPTIVCEWEEVSWPSGISPHQTPPMPNDASCKFFRYQYFTSNPFYQPNDFNLHIFAYTDDSPAPAGQDINFLEIINNSTEEPIVFTHTMQPGDGLAIPGLTGAPFFYTNPNSNMNGFPDQPLWNSYAYGMQDVPFVDTKPSPFNGSTLPADLEEDTWKMIPYETGISNDGCGWVYSVSEEYGPLAPLTIWSYTGSWPSFGGAVSCPENWASEWIIPGGGDPDTSNWP